VRYAAIQLFVARAGDVQPDFQLTEANAAAVAAICARLDGLPLAIELAAARIRLCAPQALLGLLDKRLALLTGGARDAPARQQPLRAEIAWSYELLDAAAQRLFRRLSVFVGGWTLAAAEAIATTHDPVFEGLNVLAGLASLVEQSLARRFDRPDGEPRFTMLETIREYALEELAASGESETIERRHAEYYLALAEAAELLIESLSFSRDLGERSNISVAVEGLASLAMAWRRPGQAAQLYGAAAALREAIGAPLWPSLRAEYDLSVAALRAHLGAAAFDAAWAAGRALPLDAAIGAALESGAGHDIATLTVAPDGLRHL
jgi:predicted ATPase